MFAREILIVDDEESIRFGLSGYFTGRGYAIDCASNAMDARALLTAVQYSLMVVDLRLSSKADSEGLDLIRYARQRIPRTRIILLTAHGSPEVEAEALACGADRVLGKPLSLVRLEEVVLELIDDNN